MRMRFWTKTIIFSLCLGLLFLSVRSLSGVEKKTFDDKEVGKITTTSPEAYQYYSEGRKHHVQGDYRKSIALMEKAIAIDPEFAMAYRSIATAYNNLGYQSEWKKYIQKALDVSDKVSKKERYIIQGDFYDQSEKTYDKAIEAYKKLLELDPKSVYGMNLGIIYTDLEEWDKAVEIFEGLRQNKDTSYLNYANLADAYMAKALFDKAREVLEEYQNRIGKKNWIHLRIADNYIYQGKFDLALAEVDKAFHLNPKVPWLHGYRGVISHYRDNLIEAEKSYQKLLEAEEPRANYYGMRNLASLYLQQGKFKKAKDQFKKAIAWTEKFKEMRSKAGCHGALAWVDSTTGNHDEALKELEKSWDTAVASDLTYYQRFNFYWKGLIYARMKSLDKAKEAAEEFKARVEEGMNRKEIRFYYDLMGKIELERENIAKTIEYINKILPMHTYGPLNKPAWSLENLALAYFRSGELDKAKAEYERIISLTTGRFDIGDIYAKSFYMLGKIFEEQGLKAKAIEHYEKFLDLWKDADPGIAEVEDAKKMLAGLKRQIP